MVEENNAVSLKLPVFWTTQPTVWFRQTEAQFQIRKITDDATKYFYVVAALDQSTASRLIDTLDSPPDQDKYQYLKNRLVETFGRSQRQRAAALLHIRGLGDRKPSELMDEMRALLGNHRPCFLFEQLFLEQLPEDIRLQLVSADFTDLHAVGRRADELFLAKSQMEAVAAATHKFTRKSTQREADGVCFFHSRFGTKARNCIPPCKFSGKDNAGPQ